MAGARGLFADGGKDAEEVGAGDAANVARGEAAAAEFVPEGREAGHVFESGYGDFDAVVVGADLARQGR